MEKKLLIFGATEAAILSHYYFTNDTSHEVAAFTVHRSFIKEPTLCGLPLVPFEDVESQYPPNDYRMHVSVFFGKVNKTRADLYSQAKIKGYELVSYVNSTAIKPKDLNIGDNCFIGENVSIGPFVSIGNDVIINAGSIIGHHSIIKDHCFISCHSVILGCATIEPYCFLGGNSTICHNINVARECIIGAGVTISKKTREKSVYISKTAERLPKGSDELGGLLTWSGR
jgi:sugar O-acyltransferase (sialic acid O-acetyltransferase NeuD family)